MKQFTHRNEGFICEACEAKVPTASGTCRNHCTQCLQSKHVDKNPGDRAAECGGLMRPIQVLFRSGLPVDINFKCQVCGFERKNKIVDDDNRESIAKLMEG